MKFLRPLAVVAALGAASATPAIAQQSDEAQSFFRFLQRLGGQYVIMLTRSFVDLTYDALTIEPGTNNLVISGLTLYPELEWDLDGQCAVTIDRVDSGDITSFETLETTLQVSGVHVPQACFDPGMAGMIQGFGYDGVTVEGMTIGISYDLPTSAADITIQASVKEAAEVSVAATFDYFWFRLPLDGGPGEDPEPVFYLGEAEIAIENAGLWERLEPMVAAQMGDVNAIPQMAQGMLGDMLSEGGTRQPTEQEQAFVQNLSSELARFLTEKNRIVVSVAPENSVLLEPDAIGSPGEAIAILNPQVSGVPVAYRRIISPDELSAALGGGGGLDDAAKLRIGQALITGVGAPRSVSDGEALLAPLADAWNGEAALLLAEAAAEGGDHAKAYNMALRALAAGETRAIAVADTSEAQLSPADILSAQRTTSDSWPGGDAAEAALNAMIAGGDLAGIRRMAYDLSMGKALPRDAAAAYYLASLAAAGGDRGAATLRARLDRRYGSDGDEAWASASSNAASLAVQTWTGGLGATIADRVQ